MDNRRPIIRLTRRADDAVRRHTAIGNLTFPNPIAHAIDAGMHIEVDIGPRHDRIDWGEFMSKASRAADPVALVRTADGRTGTGFMINPSIMITNNHVFSGDMETLAVAKDAEEGEVVFNFANDQQGHPQPVSNYPLVPSSGFRADARLDYAICFVDSSPGAKWGVLELPDATDLVIGDDVLIIQHPRGHPREITLTGNLVTAIDDPFVEYTTDTLPGSSGAPVFDSSWRLVALHHAGGETVEGGREVTRNQGVFAPAIRHDLEAAGWSV